MTAAHAADSVRPRLPVAAIAFDLDGTLADTVAAMEQSWNAVLSPRIGRRISRAEIISKLGPRAVEIMRSYVGDSAPAVAAEIQAAFLPAALARAQLYPGVAATLAVLSERGVPLAVVTSMGRKSAIPLLRHLGLEGRLSAIVTADDVEQLKPHPEPVLRAAELLGIDARSLLMIGDNPVDMQAANAAGAVAAAAVWGYYPTLVAAEAGWVLRSPSDIPRLVR